MKRGGAFELRTLYALTPAYNHNVRNTPDGRKLILRELLAGRWAGVVPANWKQRVHQLVFPWPSLTISVWVAGDNVRLLPEGGLSTP